jgi:hypothetical protein
MSEFAAAIEDTKGGIEGHSRAMHDALQSRFGFLIVLTGLTYLPQEDAVRVRARPEPDDAIVESQLGRGDADVDLRGIQGDITFEFE